MPERYPNLFSPIKIGSCTLKNRVILAAMGGTNFIIPPTGEFNPDVWDDYIARAKGNVGLMIPGVTFVNTAGWLYQHEDAFLGPIKALMEEIHSYGSKVFLQLGAGFGRAAHVGRGDMEKPENRAGLVSASDGIPNVWNPELKHRALTVEEIHAYVDAYGKSALLCKEAGIDGVEIHAIHEGYTLDQFATACTNHRTDEYGGSLENRLRFVSEVIREIKKTCGADYPVMVRYGVASKMRGFNKGALPGEAYEEFGRSMEESPAVARALVAAGADALDADNGSYDSWWWAHPPVYMPLHCNFPEVAYIKQFVDVPVFCAGRMEDPAFAEKTIASGQIDGIAVGRQFLTDPEWLNKAREGREADILPCIACHNGCFPVGGIPKPGQGGYPTAHCALNPVTLEEKNWVLTPAETKKRIAVVGGGVGGMECARILTLRGHAVTLFEKSDRLGGVFIAAAAPDFKEKDKMLLAWYRRQLETLKVQVWLNTEADAETVKGFDEVIVATGAAPRKLPLPGLDDPRVVEAVEYLNGVKEVGQNVVIVGGGLTGVEIAYDLARKGKKPSIVEMLPDILQVPGLCAANSNMLREIVRYYDIPVYTDTALAGTADENGFSVRVREKDAAAERLLPADSCILSVGYVPQHRLADDLAASGYDAAKTHIIGDARKVGNLMDVIHEAYALSYDL